MALTKLYWKIDNGTLYLRNNSATGYSAWTITITSGETTAPWLTTSRKDTFTKVSIVNALNITSMYRYFYGATNLKTFSGWSNITGVTNMVSCFYNCSSLITPPTIPSSVVYMNYTFYNCTAMTTPPTIPSSVVYMNNTFCQCSSLQYAPIIPVNVETMRSCFSYCSSLSRLTPTNTGTINLPTSLTDMDNCYSNCTSLTNAAALVIPSSVTNMRACFYGDTNLNYPPDMSRTSNLADLEICFYECEALQTMPTFYYIGNTDNVLLTNKVDMTRCFYYCKSLTTITRLPTFALNLDHCFQGCTSVTTIDCKIPQYVTSMQYCFANCTSLVEITDSIFFNSECLTDVTGCFADCGVLTTAPSFIVHENTSFIVSDPQPTEETWDGGKNWYIKTTSHSTDYYYEQEGITLDTSVTYYKASSFNSIAKVETMDECFEDCESLISTQGLPSSAKNLQYCFSNCKSLIEAPFIPWKVENLSNCFRNCISLVDAPEIDEDNNSIYNMYDCFGHCQKLTSVPDISNLIGLQNLSYCFNGCKALQDASGLNIPETAETNIDMTRCFYGCSELITPPDIPTTVSNMTNCFSYCTSLTTVANIDYDCVVSNMYGCYYECTNLTSAGIIPNSVKNLNSCFYDCSSLVTPPNMSNDGNAILAMDHCFYNCVNLTAMPDLSNSTSLSNMSYCFSNCESITGQLIINANPATYTDMFSGAAKNNDVILTGNSTMLQQLADTQTTGNIYVWSLNCSANIERDDDTQDTVNISVKVNRFKGGGYLTGINVSSNESRTIYSPVWYPAPDQYGHFITNNATTIFTTSISGISENKAVTFNIQVTDEYGSSNIVSITIPISFYTMDMLAGGREIAFGTRALHDDGYRLLTTEPSDWANDYTNYYIKQNGEYDNVPESDPAPTFVTNTYYELLYPQGLFKCAMSFLQMDMVGEIKQYAGTRIPNGWLECDGSTVSQTDYPLLYAAIGDTWNVGTVASGMFMLPDFRGRVAVGYNSSDTSFDTVGHTDGSKNAVLVAHTHTKPTVTTPTLTANRSDFFHCASAISANAGTINNNDSASYRYLRTEANGYSSSRSAPTINSGASCTVGNLGTTGKDASGTTNTSQAGTNANLQPYAVVKYIICAA